jgi:phosphopantothenoylcysteine decarboxylase/phosphopantothenate--cysteine ligase
MTPPLQNKEIILGVSGGIAAYKAVELLRLISKAGGAVRVVMTQNARSFVGPMTFEALSGRPVCSDLFERSGHDAAIRHIDWAREADAVVLAPATGNLIGKFANGIADDALTTLLMAVTCPVLVCPAMNTHMYESRPVQRNIGRLREDGHTIVAPGSGEMACGTTGPGRLAEPPEILAALENTLTPKDYLGRRVLVTAGPTREHFDPVRFLSNPSTGKMGYAMAAAAARRGADVILVSGPVALTAPTGVETIRVTSALEMADAVFSRFDATDVVIKTAAVADYRPRSRAAQKVKKENQESHKTVAFEKNPDILATLGERKGRQILVGFAAETENLADHAIDKMRRKHLDMIVGNRVGGAESGFGTDTNQVTFFYQNGDSETPPTMEKIDLAHLLLDRVKDRLLR